MKCILALTLTLSPLILLLISPSGVHGKSAAWQARVNETIESLSTADCQANAYDFLTTEYADDSEKLTCNQFVDPGINFTTPTTCTASDYYTLRITVCEVTGDPYGEISESLEAEINDTIATLTAGTCRDNAYILVVINRYQSSPCASLSTDEAKDHFLEYTTCNATEYEQVKDAVCSGHFLKAALGILALSLALSILVQTGYNG